MTRAREEMMKAKGGRKHYRHPVGAVADWSQQPWKEISEYIARIAAAGGAVRLGYTRDGGAYAVGVYGDGDQPYTDYLRPGEDVALYFGQLAQTFDGQESEGVPADPK